ncbi:PTS sugar transporter subunit IIB [Fusobacterium sp. IOR10]|uniref:PTS sugar transporter subunit IIB n=1 Tax=Fusobacterium sp. IOR10 TaxID=2665157 RepID=UPI0013D64BF1|nr:PTS sugar transporter subunit IIB [Fusobacterium sp. IOR10]
MIKIVTVCGNGIGSSLMCAMKIEEICKEEGIEADVTSSDFNSVAGKQVDLIVTIKQLAEQLKNYNVAEIRSYTNKRKIKEDVLDKIKELVK